LHAAAFDERAAGYDADFTNTPLGSALRTLVWARLDRLFTGAQRVLDLGCGTGEDAVYLAARGTRVLGLDASAAMVRTAQEKARQRGCAARAEFHCLPVEGLGSALPGEVFDGTLSNFGALNCVQDLAAVSANLAARLTPGARLLWVLMGRHVPWEWGWYLLRGDGRRAWRRLRQSTDWRGLRIAYPHPGEVRRLLQPHFRIDAVRPLGVALPPSYAAGWLNQRPRLLRALLRVEESAQGQPGLAYCADHYIIEATRRAETQPSVAAGVRA